MKKRILFTALILMVTLSVSWAFAQNPQALDAYKQGKSLQDGKQYSQARAMFKKAIDMDPTFADAAYEYAFESEMAEDYATAIVYYSKAVALVPTHSMAWYGLGICYEKQLKYNEALNAYTQACKNGHQKSCNNVKEMSSPAEKFYQEGKKFQKQKQYSQALMSFEKGVAVDPEHVSVRLQYGFELEMAKRYPEALAQYKLVIQKQPTNTEAYYGGGLSAKAIGNPTEAKSLFQQGCNQGHQKCCDELSKFAQ